MTPPPLTRGDSGAGTGAGSALNGLFVPPLPPSAAIPQQPPAPLSATAGLSSQVQLQPPQLLRRQPSHLSTGNVLATERHLVSTIGRSGRVYPGGAAVIRRPSEGPSSAISPRLGEMGAQVPATASPAMSPMSGHPSASMGRASARSRRGSVVSVPRRASHILGDLTAEAGLAASPSRQPSLASLPHSRQSSLARMDPDGFNGLSGTAPSSAGLRLDPSPARTSPRASGTLHDDPTLPLQPLVPRTWIMLVFGCLLMWGQYWCNEIPASTDSALQERLSVPSDTWTFYASLLYSLYAIPNIVAPFIGGLLVDNIGGATSLLLFNTFLVIGQFCFAIGTQVKAFPLLAVGRVIFGFGGENLKVAQARIISDWFRRTPYIALALGLVTTVGRVSSAVSDNASAAIAHSDGAVAAAWLGMGMIALGALCSTVTGLLDRTSSRTKAGVLINAPRVLEPGEANSSMFNRIRIFMANLFRNLRAIFTLEYTFLCICTLLLYGSVSPFMYICHEFFTTKYFAETKSHAALAMSINYIVAAVTSPLFGLFIDRFGLRASMLPFSSSLLLLSYLLLSYTSLSPFVCMVFLGFGYSIFGASTWACIPYLLPGHLVGTGYGAMVSLIQLTTVVLPLITARIRSGSAPDDFGPVMNFFVGISAATTAVCVLFVINDKRNGGRLDASSKTVGAIVPVEQAAAEAEADDIDDAFDWDEAASPDGKRADGKPAGKKGDVASYAGSEIQTSAPLDYREL